MIRLGPRQELRELTGFLAKIEDQFLRKHLVAPSLAAPTEAEILDVAAYVVLAHGALERFAEGVGLWLLGRVHSGWQLKKKANRATASLLLHLGADIPADDVSRSVYDTLRLSLDKAKTTYSKELTDNNGTSLKHLRSLFRRLGIDVPEDPTLVASLHLLVTMRHEWAHQQRFAARTVKTAADVRTIVQDCVNLAGQLVSNVTRLRV